MFKMVGKEEIGSDFDAVHLVANLEQDKWIRVVCTSCTISYTVPDEDNLGG